MNIKNLLPDNFLEHEYFNKMINFLDEDIFKNKTIYISKDYNNLPEKGKNVIAILTAGDESGNPPAYANEIQFVFKHHLDFDNIGNVFHIPLPYPNNFSGNSKTPIENRSIDVYFAGCTRSSRSLFVKELDYYMKRNKDKIKFNIKITNKFGTGYSIDIYSKLMSDSKIVLSPRGWIRSECIRFTEAVRCGCAIISDGQPDINCFRHTPYYSIPSWTSANLDRAIHYCLENQKDIHMKMKKSWESYFCPQAVAKKINDVVGGKNVN